MFEAEREVNLVLTVEQIEIILDALSCVDADDLYGPGQYEDTTGFYDSKDYQMEMIHRHLRSQLV